MEGEKVTESFNEWEQIQSPTNQPRGWEMVAFGDNKNHLHQADLSIFPPINHEGLKISQPPPPPPESTQTAPGSSGDVCSNVKAEEVAGSESRPKVVLRNGIGKLLKAGGRLWIASRVRHNYVISGGRFCSFASFSTVLVAAIFLFSRWRKRLLEERKHRRRLILLIKEKDQTISHLLLQIAQLKEMLSAGRRQPVPVIRVG